MARIHRMFPEFFAKQRADYRNQLYKESWLWKRCKNQELYILKLQNQLNQTQRKRRYEP